MDCSPPDAVHGILQARILAWAAMPYSRGSSWPRDLLCLLHWQAVDSLPLSHLGRPEFPVTCMLSSKMLMEAYHRTLSWSRETCLCPRGRDRIWRVRRVPRRSEAGQAEEKPTRGQEGLVQRTLPLCRRNQAAGARGGRGGRGGKALPTGWVKDGVLRVIRSPCGHFKQERKIIRFEFLRFLCCSVGTGLPAENGSHPLLSKLSDSPSLTDLS